MLNRRTFVQAAASTATATVAATALPSPALAAEERAAQASRRRRLEWGPISAETRPWTRWWWLGSAVTGNGLTRHLLRMHQAGLGGVEIQPIYEAQGFEDQVREYLSPEWLQAVDTAVRRADSVGMQVDLTSGSGWTMGGPWIAPEISAGKVLVERWSLEGGQQLEEPVRATQPDHPGLVDEEKLSRPDLRPPTDPLPEPPLDALVAREQSTGETVVLTDRVDADRRLDWTAPEGSWELTGVFAGLALKRVERAGPGGKGLMADYFAGTGLTAHLQRLDASLGRGSRGLRASFHDSYELEATDWSRTFLEDFGTRRGYDLAPYLPDLFAESPDGPDETTLRVTADVRQTLSELFVDNFCTPWNEWSHRHGWLTRNQAHGSPANLLDVYGAADIPETEYTGGEIVPIPGLRQGLGDGTEPVPLVWRMASSAAHLTGGRLASAEAITWRDEHRHVSLSQAKPAMDLLFAAGINHIVYHGSTYTPDDVAWPGFTFYAATNVDPHDNIWHDLTELNGYITRCQSVLQDGEHDNDVLVYWPQADVWARPDGGTDSDERELSPDYHWSGEPWMYGEADSPGELVGGIEDAGWQLDWVSDTQLQQFRTRRGQVANRHSSYAVVVVPRARLMPVETIERLEKLASGGGTVVFVDELPSDVPGWSDLADRRQRFAAVLDRIRPGTGAAGRQVGRGRVVLAERGADLDAALAVAGARREPVAESGVRVLRRRHDHGRHYFITNCTAETVSGWFPLGVDAASVGLLDPLHDRRGAAQSRRQRGRAEVRLELEPGQSVILRTFDRYRLDAPTVAPPAPADGGLDVTGPWELTFLDGGPQLPATRTLDTLADWTGLGEQELAFSGTARYRTTVRVDERDLGPDWLLDLGDLRESARVRVNGEQVGTAWAIPFLVPLGGALRAGENVLEIEVTNLSANRYRATARAGDLTLPHYMSWRSGEPPEEWDPMPSGLLGPVRLVPAGE